MIKPYICYKKNCWSTDFSVLSEAAKKEEDHTDENLVQRSAPHTHKENEVESIGAIENDEQTDKYQNNEIKFYGPLGYDEEFSVKSDKNSFGVSHTNQANMSHDHDLKEFAEYLIEFPLGKFRVSNLYRGIIGEMKKLKLIPDYLVNVSNRY